VQLAYLLVASFASSEVVWFSKMTMSRREDWLSFISSLPTNQSANEHMTDIMSLVSYRQDKDQSLSVISKNPGLSLLIVDGFMELILLHSLDYLPANVLRSDNRLVALSGADARADCYRVDPSSALQDLEFATPVWRDLKNASTQEAIETLQASDQNSSSYKGKQSLLVPPLVTITILEAKTRVPAKLIPILSTKFQEFDRSSSTVKACTVLRPVLEFLWAAHHKKIPSTIVGLDNSLDAQSWSSKMHLTSILPPGPPPFRAPPPPSLGVPQDQASVDTIVGELRLLQDAQDKQHLREIEIDEEKKCNTNGWEKFPEEVQTMILRMTATSDDRLPIAS